MCKKLQIYEKPQELYDNPESLKDFMYSAADINLQNEHGNVALHYVANNPECLKILLDDERIDVTIRDNLGKTVLHYAVYNPESLEILLADERVDVNAVNNSGYTALHYAFDKPESLEILLADRRVDVNVKNKYGKTALDSAIIHGNAESEKLLRDAVANFNSSPDEVSQEQYVNYDDGQMDLAGEVQSYEIEVYSEL